MHTIENQSLTLKEATTVADERASIAYAMWVSFDFYCEVLQSFVDLRNGRMEEAVERALATMSESDADKRRDVVWENIQGMRVVNQRTALSAAGIKHPIIFMKAIRVHKREYLRLQDEGKIIRQTYAAGKWTDRFTQEGFQWLIDKSKEMNEWVDGIKNSKKKLNLISKK